MKATTVTMLGLALFAITLTSLWAAGKGQRAQGDCQSNRLACQQSADSCPLADTPTVTLTGTIRDLTLPEAGSHHGPAHFTLVSGDTSTLVQLGPPHALAAIGLTLTNEATVTLVGWTVTSNDTAQLVVHDLTLGENTYLLRTPAGTPVWQAGGGRGQGAGRGAGKGKGNGTCTAE